MMIPRVPAAAVPRINKVVTDREPAEPWKRFFQEQNIEVVYPEESDN